MKKRNYTLFLALFFLGACSSSPKASHSANTSPFIKATIIVNTQDTAGKPYTIPLYNATTGLFTTPTRNRWGLCKLYPKSF